ncbi:uncharacterized protein LOC114342703 [Diabrotica virgifera virgifera]|uniref:Uncharacterized protein LOC114342703 n=1 Tax=Diabrotica virgifera virgifera TaxID=50390 RepID=A0A6P7GTE9_DIAVI|nr:uncharacterized protein LOC114342703 [Diabrotica virgifera virgifera]
MNWIMLTVFIFLGLTNAEKVPERRAVLRRATRRALESTGGSYFADIENEIINNCVENGLSSSGADDLKVTFAKMKYCMSGTSIYKIAKNEYISKIEECSRDAFRDSTACLANKQKYLPEFVLDYVQSIVEYLYDVKDLYADSEIIGCLKNFGRYAIQIEYIKCLATESQKAGADQNIPNSRQEYCRIYVPASQCFPNTYKQYCPNTEKINKLFTDFNNAVMSPCQE